MSGLQVLGKISKEGKKKKKKKKKGKEKKNDEINSPPRIEQTVSQTT